LATRYGYDEAALHRKIQALGFIPCFYVAMERRLVQVPPEAQGNIIYVRDFAFVQERLRTAAPFRFAGREI